MPTSHTTVTVYNLALDMIGNDPLVTTADVSPYARWLNRNFSHAVEAALRLNPWNFATELHDLSSAPDEPAYRWKYFYDLPNGWLRVLPPTYNGEAMGQPLQYAVSRNRLMMNYGPSQRVGIVFNVQNPGEWDPLFAGYVAAQLAHGMAHRFTQKASYVQLTKQAADAALAAAEEINAFEGSIDPVDQHDIIRTRGSWDTGLNRGWR